MLIFKITNRIKVWNKFICIIKKINFLKIMATTHLFIKIVNCLNSKEIYIMINKYNNKIKKNNLLIWKKIFIKNKIIAIK